jgi:hypothetical protein
MLTNSLLSTELFCDSRIAVLNTTDPGHCSRLNDKCVASMGKNGARSDSAMLFRDIVNDADGAGH